MRTPRRKVVGRKHKQCDKNPKNKNRTENRLRAQLAVIQDKLAAIESSKKRRDDSSSECSSEVSSVCEHHATPAEKRVVIKFFYEQLKCPPEEDWSGHYGTISRIRKAMKGSAPAPQTVYSTLLLLVDDDPDIALCRKGVGGRKREMSEEEEIFAGLMLCEGYSQRATVQWLNMERTAAGQKQLSRSQIQRAEKRVELRRRRRRKTKAGNYDLESDWAKASVAQSVQFKAQLEAGARAQGPALDGPVLKVGSERVATSATDPWKVVGSQVKVVWEGWPRKGGWPCEIAAHAPQHKGVRQYVLRDLEGKQLYMFTADQVYKLLSSKQQKQITALVAGYSDAPPPFVLEQVLFLDEKHRKCSLGKDSEYDCGMPHDEDGKWQSADDGGEYDDWSDNVSMKYAKDARFLFGVCLGKDSDGQLVGRRAEPFDYTGYWITGVKKYRTAMQDEVARANRLKGGGTWACTKKYSAPDLAKLAGGRYEAWRIEKHGSGDGWEDDVKAAIGKGEGAVMCVTELMDHAISEGNRLFAGTQYANTWFLYHDHLSAWWEAEAQAYLDERGFKDRQVRAVGETNAEFSRYHNSLVGNRPEMMPLDFHLFEDLDHAVLQNIIATSSLPAGHQDRYCSGTPRELASAMRRTWAHYPTSERIVEDITRWPIVLEKIIEHDGGTVPDLEVAHNGCSKRKKGRNSKPIWVPPPDIEPHMKKRQAELRDMARQRMVKCE